MAIARFTLVELKFSALNDKPEIHSWSPGAYEEPALTSGHVVLGVTMTEADTGEPVAVMKRGYLRDVARQNGETWASGDILYATANGSISNVRPDGPMPQVLVGTVFDTSGVLHTVDVDVRVLPSIAELSGVTRETLVNLDVLIYNGTTHAWVPRQIDHGGDIAGLLDDDHTQYLKEKLSGGTAAETPEHTHQAAATCGTLDHGLAMTDASLADNDHPQYKMKHGFERGASGEHLVTISYDKTTRKITVTPTGATFDIWINGVKYTKTGAQVQGTGHANSTGQHFVYYDSSGVLQVLPVNTPWSIVDTTVIPVAMVYYYTGISDGICFFEAHEAKRNLALHYNLHFTQGGKYISGGALTGYTLNTASDAAVTFAIATARIADEDIVRDLTAVSDGGPYTVMYRTGADGDWTWDSTPTLPFLGTTYPAWNNINAGGAGVWGLTDLVGTGGGTYTNYYLVAVPSVAAATQFVLIPSQATYATSALAQAETLSSLSLGSLPFVEMAALYRLTFHGRSTHAGTKKARLVAVTSITNTQSVTIAGSPTAHGSLSGRSAADSHPASAITFTPYSTLVAEDVQTAIQELLDEIPAGPAALDDLGDVNAPSPSNGDLLSWDSTPGEWVNIAPPAGTLSGLSDVDVTGIASGDGLYWNPVSGFWEPSGAPPPGAHASTHEALGSDPLTLDTLAAPTDITDLNASTSAHGLCPKGSGVAGEFLAADLTWDVPAGAATLNDLTDVNAPSPSNGQVLTWDSTPGEWVPDTASAVVASLDDVGDCNVASPSNGDVLTWDSTPGEWVPAAPAGGSVTMSKTFIVHTPPAGTTTFPYWNAEQAATIIKVRSYMIGSGSCGVNVTVEAADVLASDQTPTAAWGVSAALTQAVASGDDIAVAIRSVTGVVSYVVVQIDFTV